jgi:sec-independent protein translocase protein TatC
MHLEMNAWTIDSYISFATTFMLGMGIAFEFPLIILVLAKIGIVTYEFLAKSRGYAIIVILIISAIVTPSSDAFTMCIMASPLVFMYEACVWAAWLMQKKK